MKMAGKSCGSRDEAWLGRYVEEHTKLAWKSCGSRDEAWLGRYVEEHMKLAGKICGRTHEAGGRTHEAGWVDLWKNTTYDGKIWGRGLVGCVNGCFSAQS